MTDLDQTLDRAIRMHQQGRLADAEAAYRRVLDIEPGNFDGLHLLGIVRSQQGSYEEAEALIARALAVDPDAAPAWANRGVALTLLKRFPEALTCLDRALSLDPGFANALGNRGDVFLASSQPERALADYDRALALAPKSPDVLFNRGNALRALRRFDEAVIAYERVVALRPAHAAAWANQAKSLLSLGRFQEAIESADTALSIRPDLVPALRARAAALAVLGRAGEAMAAHERLLASGEENYALGEAVNFQTANLLWDGLDTRVERIVAGVRSGKAVVTPFTLITLGGTPRDQLKCAVAYAGREYPPAAEPLWRGERYDHDRVRLAYLSADYYEHATAHLMAGLIERHDRKRFEVTGISFGPSAPSAMRRRIEGAFDRFVDVAAQSDRQTAETIRALEIDIAVDLKGFTRDSRPGILAHRPAPVQVSYLGFPGTMGAPYIDFIVADRVVIPPADRDFYSEEVVYLPDTYQATDDRRPVAGVPDRASCGLPNDAVIFCAFHNPFKITPAILDIWCRLVRSVEGSVIWFLDRGEGAAHRNLVREAASRGLQPERMRFAKALPQADHLARMSLADLFLDTLPCGAHTTASDALWVGVPVVTCLGETFAGRVGASVLSAIGMPELITSTLHDYERLALRLAWNPQLLRSVKAKLLKNRGETALFNTDRFRTNIEAAYLHMMEQPRIGDRLSPKT
ncbi:MAG: tetratricopeptide repeat protein [Bauldia sp.]